MMGIHSVGILATYGATNNPGIQAKLITAMKTPTMRVSIPKIGDARA